MSLPIILRIFKGDHIVEVKQFQLDQIVIGNQAEVNVSLNDPAVTSIHSMIERRGDAFYLCDLGSAQGTFKNDKAVLDETIESGESFFIGPFRLQFSLGVPRPRTQAPNTVTTEMVEQALIPSNPLSSPNFDVLSDPSSALHLRSEEAKDLSTSVQTFVVQNSTESEVVIPPVTAPQSQNRAPVSSDYNTEPQFQIHDKLVPSQASVPSAEGAPAPVLVQTSEVSSQPNPQATVGSGAHIINEELIVKAKSPATRPDLLKKAFVPPAAIQEEDKVIKASKGSVLEVSVGWRERIIETYHFRGNRAIVIGSGEKADIQIPRGVFRGSHTIVDFNNGVAAINFRSEMTGNLLLESHTRDFAYLKEKGRLSPSTRGHDVLRLDQGEAVRVSLVPDLINIYVRYVPATKKPNLLPFIPFTTGEVASVILATALVGLLAFYNAIHAPIEEPEEKIEPEIVAVTKFVYPTVKPPPEPVAPVTPPPEPVVVKEPPKPKTKLVLGEKTATGSQGTTGVGVKSTSGSAGSRAAEAAPNSNKNANKKFTSVNQGGGVKLGAQAGANAAQSNKDVDLSDVGLVSAFGGGGARSKLSKAVHGAGDVIGDSAKATGHVGFGKDRPGDDLGSALKSDGAGGKGVATEGISGGITNGRGSGNAGYGGVGSGLGEKGGVAINVGGQGESMVGTIDKNGVRRVILSKQAVIRRCYEKELRFKKSLGGRVMMVFEINETGRVNYAKVENSTLGDAGVESCLKNELVTWQFPETPAGSVAEIHFPFSFQPKD